MQSDPPFEPADLARWRADAQKALKGAPLERLVTRLVEGLEVQPLYTDAPRRARTPGVDGAPFAIVAPLDLPVAGPLDAAIADEASGGADAVALDPATFTTWPAAGPSRALSAVGTPAAAAALRARLPAAVTLCPLVDPSHPEAPWTDPAHLDAALALPDLLKPHGVVLPLHRWHEAGADLYGELGAGLALLAATVRLLASRGVAPDAAIAAMTARVALGSDLLMQIARLRAWRGLVARVLSAAGLPETPQPALWAETSRRALTRHGPHTNLLRGTAAAFAAIAGGAQLISVQPFDAAARPSEADARRLARNTLHILGRESHLGAVADPAAGSFAIESWTDALMRGAWAFFQALEADGGFFSDGAQARLAAHLDAARAARLLRLGRRQDGLIGTSLFIDPAEAPSPGSTLDDRLGGPRDAQPFEALRARAAAGAPAVFVANVGPLSDQQARTSWVRDLLAAGGLTSRDGGDGFADGAAAQVAFSAAPTRQAIIAASDALYPELVPALAASLKAAGAQRVLVAGRPGPAEAAWRSAGVDAFIHAGLDILTCLDEALTAEGL